MKGVLQGDLIKEVAGGVPFEARRSLAITNSLNPRGFLGDTFALLPVDWVAPLEG